MIYTEEILNELTIACKRVNAKSEFSAWKSSSFALVCPNIYALIHIDVAEFKTYQKWLISLKEQQIVMILLISIANMKLEYLKAAFEATFDKISTGVCTMNIITQVLLWKAPKDIAMYLIGNSKQIKSDDLHSVTSLAEGILQMVQFGFLYNDQDVFEELIKICPNNLFQHTLNKSGRTSHLMTQLLIEDQAWSADLLKVMVQSNHFDLAIKDKDHNNILHQLALQSNGNPKLNTEQFCERLDSALNTFEINLRDTNIHRMTIRDILTKQKFTAAVKIVDEHLSRQQKLEQKKLDDLLLSLSEDKKQKPSKKQKKKNRKRQRLLENQEHSDDKEESKDSSDHEMFNPQDSPHSMGWNFDAESPKSEQPTPFMASQAEEQQEEKMINADDYEKVKAQKEFAVKQTIDQQQEIEKLRAEMELLKAKQEEMLSALARTQTEVESKQSRKRKSKKK